MSLNNIVDVTISTTGARVTTKGFGIPLILSPTPSWVERSRSYDDSDAILADGFLATDPAYLAAVKAFAQEPSPEKVIIGRQALKPTQRFAITPVAVNSAVYRFWIDGTLVSYTADASATVAEIILGLKTAADLLGLAITTSDQTTYLRVLANTAGAFFSLEVETTALLGIAQDHVDPGLATDLAAIKLETDEWYAVIHLFNSKACVEAIALYVEANEKLFVAQSQDSAIITTALSGTDDVAESLRSLAYARTALIYHPETAAFADAAWAGRCLPLDPGSETWKFKTLAGVDVVVLTSTHRTNLEAKNCNYYEEVAGIGITAQGIVSALEFIDVVRGRDWLKARLQEAVYAALVEADKIPFTDAGVAVIQGIVLGVLGRAVRVGLLSPDPKPECTVPKVADVDPADKAARHLPDVNFDGVLAGAIHALEINGKISV